MPVTYCPRPRPSGWWRVPGPRPVQAQRARFARALAGLHRAGRNDEPLPAAPQGPPRGAPEEDPGRPWPAGAARGPGGPRRGVGHAGRDQHPPARGADLAARRGDRPARRPDRPPQRAGRASSSQPGRGPAGRKRSASGPNRRGRDAPGQGCRVRRCRSDWPRVRLLAGGGRAPGDPQTLRVPPGTELAELQLDLERDDHPRYRAVLQTAEGRPVATRSDLESRRDAAGEGIVVLRLPASDLPTGDYVVRLTGLTASGAAEPVDAYSFTVVHAPTP